MNARKPRLAVAAGAVGFDRTHEVMSQVHPFGWHANIQLDGRELPQLLLDWAPDDATRKKILVDNPAELYGLR